MEKKRRDDIMNMRSPKVGVIIASHNHENYFAESIESVLQQAFQDFEIIITDDGSVDTTVEQIKKIHDPRSLSDLNVN